ncbi:MAG: hypothetical protein P9L99_18440 [Candidatus Lernaella stagnicola]|nr:hypothetical protein [Candidatus Lernaella stagnicola]
MASRIISSPWLLAIALGLVVIAQVVVFLALPTGSGDAVLVPIRPPLTRPAPEEALLIPGREPPPPRPDERTAALADQAAHLRVELARDAQLLGAAVNVDQLLFILGQRDRLVRDQYEGQMYVELQDALAERSQP